MIGALFARLMGMKTWDKGNGVTVVRFPRFASPAMMDKALDKTVRQARVSGLLITIEDRDGRYVRIRSTPLI